VFVTLALLCHRHRWYVLVGWLLALLVAGYLATTVTAKNISDTVVPGSQSQAATKALDRAGMGAWGGRQAQIVFSSDDVTSSATRSRITGLLDRITAHVDGVRLTSPYAPHSGRQLSDDHTIGYAGLTFSERTPAQFSADAAAIEAEVAKARAPGLRIEIGGDDDFAAPGSFSTEGIGMMAAVVILLIAFGSVLAMLVPIGAALFGVGTGLSLLALGPVRSLDHGRVGRLRSQRMPPRSWSPAR